MSQEADDPAAATVRSVLEGIVIDTPEGPMVLREVCAEPTVIVHCDIFVVPDEPVTGTLVWGET